MARIKAREGQGAVVSGANPFRVITPGFYFAQVVGGELGTREGKWNGVPGKFTYQKLTPHFEVFAEQSGDSPVAAPLDNPVQITRQDFTIGALDKDGFLFRPDGDGSKSPIWGGRNGVADLLKALGFADISEFDTVLLSGQVVKVRVDNENYEKVDQDTGDVVTRTKNVIIGVYPVSAAIVEANEWVSHEGRRVFRDDAWVTVYEDALAHVDDDERDPFDDQFSDAL